MAHISIDSMEDECSFQVAAPCCSVDRTFLGVTDHCFNPFNPKYIEWYSPSLALEHTIQVCRGEMVNGKTSVKVSLFQLHDTNLCSQSETTGKLLLCLVSAD